MKLLQFTIIALLLMLKYQVNSVQITCQFLMSNCYLDVLTETQRQCYTCLVESPNILQQQKNQINSEAHEKFNSEVKHIEFIHGNVNYIPIEIYQFFTDVDSISIKHTMTQAITQNFFKNANKMKHFLCSETSLVSIGANSFNNAKNIELMHLQNNQIANLHQDAFRSLRRLKYLNLSGNKIVVLDKALFSDQEKLLRLFLDHNKISKVDSSTFVNAKSLKFLALNNNEIESLASNTFIQQFQLRELALHDNKIKTISRTIFTGQGQLLRLFLQNNQLTRVEAATFADLKGLKILKMEGNKIESVDQLAFQGASDLELINLNRNKISYLPAKAFSSLPKLRVLWLKHNVCINKNFTSAQVAEYEIGKTCQTNVPRTTTSRPNRGTTVKSSKNGCYVPVINNGKVTSSFFGTSYKAGQQAPDLDYVEVQCLPEFTLLTNRPDDNKILCKEGQFDKIFPKCTSGTANNLCDGNLITGHAIESTCQLNNRKVSCEGYQVPSTQADVSCKLGYRQSQIESGTKFDCRSDGTWDEEPINCVPGCGILRTIKSTPLLVGGINTNISQVPWNVGVYRRGQHICGASIISSRVVISAAHCFFSDNTGGVTLNKLEYFQIVAGKYYNNINAREPLETQTFGVVEIRTVPGYNGYEGFFVADIAAVILNNKIQFRPHIAPVCLDYNYDYSLQSELPFGQVGLVAGWGLTKSGGAESEELKTLRMPVVGFTECSNKADYFRPFLVADKFCGGYADGTGVCQGDSGGGFVFTKTIGGVTAYYLRGVVSNGRHSPEGCDVNFYALFTNVHVYLSLVQKAVKDFN